MNQPKNEVKKTTIMDSALIKQAREKISAVERVVVITHIRPDGDAVGSLLGIGLALEKLGKDVQLVISDRIPNGLKFLRGSKKIQSRMIAPIDLVIVVDCSELSRVGDALHGEFVPDINIDHHITNTLFAKINLVDPDAAATTEIISKYLNALGMEFDRDVVNALMAGILSDTIGFRTTSVRPETLRQAANLMERGADISDLYKKALSQQDLNALRYWGAGLSSMQCEDRMVWTELSLEERKQAGYPGKDDADLINILSAVKDIDIAVIFVEQTGGSVKISWRAQNGYDVSKVAVHFGGGGHRAASGAEVKGPLNDVKSLVLEETRLLFRK
jgi:bifunctional oligoribonuclease and PAP phosphatase NrnA